MNLSVVSKFLGIIATLIGVTMAFSLPWSFPIFGGDWKYEAPGFFGITLAMVVCFIVGWALRRIGRRAHHLQLFRKEAMAVVGLSWILATFLGGLPYVFSGTERADGVPMTLVDAIFEAQSGFSTTGATVLSELEGRLHPDDPELAWVPRCILFWRSSTHYLGGLGIIVLFVVVLGQGSAGKAMMRAEMPGPSQSTQQARMQHTAWILFYIYTGLNIALTLLLLLEGLPLFDAICHAFGTMATGGFSTYNASAGHFTTDPNLPGGLIEMTIILFMVLAGTNFMLFYLMAFKGPKAFWHDAEWRIYIAIILVATVAVLGTGMANGDFDHYGTSDRSVLGGAEPTEEHASLGIATRYSLFQVVSIMTTTGFCTDEFENWNAFSCGLLVVLMFVGGCAGSTGGGMKVIRHILCAKILGLEVERAFHPSVIRPLRVGGETVDEPHIRRGILVYFALIAFIFVLSWLFVLGFEPDSTWTGEIADASAETESGADAPESVEIPPASMPEKAEHKLIDSATSVAATLNNIGPGLGLIGARQNYGSFSLWTKLLFTWLMMLGRLELFVILVLFLPGFWKHH